VLKRSSHAAPAGSPSPPDPNILVISLLGWFQTHARDLPWRKQTQAYGVWVSEIMLQQTQVATVIPFWNRWMKRLPDIPTLAKAKPTTVIKLWEGLGYYSRPRNLQAAARRMRQIHRAQVPNTLQELLALPGIGRYTAGAILSIAFDQPAPILDGNVMRVLARLFRLAGDPRTGELNRKLWQLSGELVQCASLAGHPTRRPCAAFNQALMELGALICLPSNPACDACPVRSVCGAYLHGEVDGLPSPRPKQRYRKQRMAAFVLQKGNRFFVRQRPSFGVNSRLWEFPGAEFSRKSEIAKAAATELDAKLSEPTPFLTIHHAIMNRRITTEAYRVIPKSDSLAPLTTARFYTMPQLRRLTFPSAHRRIVDYLDRHSSPPPTSTSGGTRHRKALRPTPRKKRHETNGET